MTIQDGRNFLKKIKRRLKKEYSFLFPITIYFVFKGRKETYHLIVVFDEKGYETMGRWERGEGVLGEWERWKRGNTAKALGNPPLRKNCIRVEVLHLLHKIEIFQNFKKFEDWVKLPRDAKLEIRVRKDWLENFQGICEEKGMKMGDLVRSAMNDWLFKIWARKL